MLHNGVNIILIYFFTDVKKFKYDSSYLKQKQIMENDLSYWESIRD